MKIREMLEIYSILKGLKLNKFENKELRKNLILLFMVLGSEVKKFFEKEEELKNHYFSDKQDEIQYLIGLESRIKEEKDSTVKEKLIHEQLNYAETYELMNDYINVMNELKNDSVELNFTKIDKESFIEGVSEDLTLENFEILSLIFQ